MTIKEFLRKPGLLTSGQDDVSQRSGRHYHKRHTSCICLLFSQYLTRMLLRVSSVGILFRLC